jgi:hypothetical protein
LAAVVLRLGHGFEMCKRLLEQAQPFTALRALLEMGLDIFGPCSSEIIEKIGS